MDLSILIPARNEDYLGKTIEDLLKNIRGKTEIIYILDGYDTPFPKIPKAPNVTMIGHTTSVGQRAATNEAARLSTAKYLMKVDAHCSFDEGFDVKMIGNMQDDWTMTPLMRNLHVFNWRCVDCGDETYQGPPPEGCKNCDVNTPDRFEKVVKWRAKSSPRSTAYRFNTNLQFKYFGELKERQKIEGGHIVETMSLQGSCFMMTRDKYHELNICDESWGSWGQQGTEVALKTWLSGGRVVCNTSTWYAHLFRTQSGFSFPWQCSGKSQQNARNISQELFLNNKWEKQIYPLSWLLEKFWPELLKVNDPENKWTAADLERLKKIPLANGKPLSKGIVYYTDNQLDSKLLKSCQGQLDKVTKDIKHAVSVSLKPIGFKQNIVLDEKRGHLTMFKQILKGLKQQETDIVFICEHDVLYPKEHFDFVPPRKDTFYYNNNVWFLRLKDGHALHYEANQVSGLCAYRESLIKHYEERVKLVEKEGYSRQIGFEPMTHNRIKWVNKFKCESWQSPVPLVDIKHGGNLMGARWKKSEFRNQKFTKGWEESENFNIPGWENLKEILNG